MNREIGTGIFRVRPKGTNIEVKGQNKFRKLLVSIIIELIFLAFL